MFGENTDTNTIVDYLDINVNVDINVEVDADDLDDGEIQFLEIDVMVEQDLDGILNCTLPDNHHRCAAHTLNLVASEDSLEALHDPDYKRVSRRAGGKLQALWNKQGRSSLFAEIVKDQCGKMLKSPNATRWNSYYDAFERVSELLNSKRNKLDIVFTKMVIPKLLDADVEFIHEFVKVS
jgi:hypothetical protein